MKKGVENEHTPKGQEGAAALMTVTSTSSNRTKVLMLEEYVCGELVSK